MSFLHTGSTSTTTTTTRIITPSSSKKALCVGINNYPDPKNRLLGCVNDAIDWGNYLRNIWGFSVQTIVDNQATSKNFKEILSDYIVNSKAGDYIVGTYSGHGSNVEDTNGDEDDGRDECICLYDRFFIDDEIRELFRLVHPEATLVFISDSCLSGDTKIPLLDGTTPTIEELSKRDDKFWVYSCSEDGNIAAGEAHSARKTKTAEIIKVVFDNGEFLECTDDHLIMLRDGTYRKAGELKPLDSLMPFYRITHDGEDNKYLKGYEMIKNPSNNKWIPTHLMVKESCNLKNSVSPNCSITHHIDFNKRNNDPSNLKMCSWEDHKKMHGEVGKRNLTKLWESPKFRAWRDSDEYKKEQSQRIKEKWNEPLHHASHKKANIERFCKNGMSQKFLDYNFSDKNIESSKKRHECSGDLYEIFHDESFQTKFRSASQSIETKTKRSKTRQKSFKDPNSNLYKAARRPERIELMRLMSQYRQYLKQNSIKKTDMSFKNWKENILMVAVNHKVKEIIRTGKIVDVYDMTVEKYHNFSIESGIFVHNCHSGTVTRAFLNAMEKNESGDERLRPRYIPPENDNEARSINLNKVSTRIFYPESGMKEILIAGCLPTEYSYDARLNGRNNGSFTAYALQILKQNRNITFKDFYAKLNQLLPSERFPQTPCLEGSDTNKSKLMFQ